MRKGYSARACDQNAEHTTLLMPHRRLCAERQHSLGLRAVKVVLDGLQQQRKLAEHGARASLDAVALLFGGVSVARKLQLERELLHREVGEAVVGFAPTTRSAAVLDGRPRVFLRH